MVNKDMYKLTYLILIHLAHADLFRSKYTYWLINFTS